MEKEKIINHWRDKGAKHIETENQFRELLSSMEHQEGEIKTREEKVK